MLLAVLLAAPACGGDDEPVADTGVATGVDPGADTAVDPDVDADADADGSSNEAPSGDPGWCAAARKVQEASLAMDVIDPTDPEAVEAAITLMLERAEAAAPLAPPELVADVGASLELMRRLDAALAEVGYDFVRADLSGVLDGGASSAANDRIEEYNAERCGLTLPGGEDGEDGDPGGHTDGPVFDPADGPVRDQTIALLVDEGFTEDEAACLFDHIDLSDPDFATDEERLVQLVETCGLDVERLMELGG